MHTRTTSLLIILAMGLLAVCLRVTSTDASLGVGAKRVSVMGVVDWRGITNTVVLLCAVLATVECML